MAELSGSVLGPAPTSPATLSTAAGNLPENRNLVTMQTLKLYQRKKKKIKEEKEHLDMHQNWVPETPAKPVPAKLQYVYLRRSLARSCKEEAEANSDVSVAAFAGVKEGKEHESRGSEISCLISDGALDLNKAIFDSEDAAISMCDSKEAKCSGNFVLDTPPVECAIDNTGNLQESNNQESHTSYQEKDTQLEDGVYSVNRLEPQTPSIKSNKRPRSSKDTHVRPTKKKKHRPKVVSDGVPTKPIKNSPPKKEKRKRQTQKKEKKNLVRRNLSSMMLPTTSELSSIHHSHNNVPATLDLNLETMSKTIFNVAEHTSDEKIVEVEILDIGNHKRDESMVLPVITELDDVAPLQSDMGLGICPETTNNGCRNMLRDRGLIKGFGCEHKGNLCVKKCIEEVLSFPKRCKKMRKKSKRRPKMSIVLVFFLIKGHIKKKRSKSMRRGKMAARLLVDELVSCFGSLVLNDLMESHFRSELKSEKKETRQVNPFEMRQFPVFPRWQTDSLCEQNLLQLIDKTTGDFAGPRVSIEEGAIVPHLGSSPQKSTLVLHQKPLSTKKIKPVIDLDPESMRQWILIKRKEDGLDCEEEEVDEETKKRWKEDKEMFKQRIDLFNKIMHEVLGDRRFKPWKGSVVDSVVGVFLTQNVSDFLSSSAYMSLVAKFPYQASNQEEFLCSQESTGSTSGTIGIPQYIVTETTEEDEGGLCDIEDIGKPNLDRVNQSLCSSPSGCHDDNSKIMQDFLFENMIKETILSNMSVLTQDCSSQVEAGIEKNLDGMDSVDMQDKTSFEEVGKTTPKKKNVAKKKEEPKKDWDSLRRKYSAPRCIDHTDSVDWNAVRQADVNVIAETIKSRGQHTILAERIKGFLDRVVELHGSIDLEWLRFAPPMIVKEYLLDVEGLGLKSVECIRLLELGHIAFPVDVNVARILVRLGWVPLKPLPGDLLFHLLEEYPIMDSVQKYVWPRLSQFSHEILYEFHYQLITFGKVFCKKRSPNCNSCPMRAECRHFASAVAASANLHLPAPANKNPERSIVPNIPPMDSQSPSGTVEVANPKAEVTSGIGLELTSCVPSIEVPISPEHVQTISELEEFRVTSDIGLETSGCVPSVGVPLSPEHVQTIKELRVTSDIGLETSVCVPSVELPKSPENEQNAYDNDVDDIQLIDSEKEEEIPCIRLNNEVFKENVLFYWEKYRNNVQDGDGIISRDLVPLPVDVNSVSLHQLKRTNHLRTEHQVYEIPDSHELLIGLERRDAEDCVPYLLAIWTAGETPNSVKQPQKKCNSQGSNLCDDQTCFACQSICEGNADIVRGTILIPCRTAMKARFPLNGTYFQVNEVFTDHETSHKPLIIPRSSIWYLKRRMVFFSTSPSAIFTKNCSLQDIQKNFWTGFICLRGFDRKTRAPKPLAPRFHCSPSKMERKPRKVNPNKTKNTPQGLDQEKVNVVNKFEAAI